MIGSRTDSAGEEMDKYARLHFVAGVAKEYDDVYAPATYDSAMWKLQLPHLRRTLRSVLGQSGRLKYLDFACGTGRIIAAANDLATEATGVDISPLMLQRAAQCVSTSTLRCGDILRSPELVDTDYDAITAFRFFLNTDVETRRPVMRDLARRLRGPASRLIFNIHGSSGSVLALTTLYRQLRGWPPLVTMSHSDVARLVRDATLEIESVRGYGLLPRRLYRTRLAGLARVIDAVTCRLGILAHLSQDVVYVCRLRSGAMR